MRGWQKIAQTMKKAINKMKRFIVWMRRGRKLDREGEN